MSLISFDGDHDAGGKVRLAMPDHVVSQAVYSPCRHYRYMLHRRWEHASDRSIMFVMLNPSTATEDVDDPTVRKCRSYASRWGYNHLIIGNIMAYRATDPGMLRRVSDPIGPENHQHLRHAIGTYQPMLICAWGSLPKRLMHAETAVIALLREVAVTPYALRMNASGSPGHPLYLAMHTTPTAWTPSR
jgi:hypothetical protein